MQARFIIGLSFHERPICYKLTMKINLSALRAKFFHDAAEPGDDIPLQDMGILDHIEKTVEISKKYDIEKCLAKGKKHLDYITGKLGISPVQAVLFSHFLERSSDNHIGINDIAEAVKCSKVRIIKYMNECDVLEKKGLFVAVGETLFHTGFPVKCASLCGNQTSTNRKTEAIYLFPGFLFFLNRSLRKETKMN